MQDIFRLKKLEFIAYLLIGFMSVLFLTRPAWATITIVSVENASSYDSTNNVVYGGLAGALTNSSSCINRGTSSTCDSCYDPAGDGDYNAVPCNNTRVFDELILKITIKSDSLDGVPALTTNVTDGQTSLTLNSQTSGVVTTGSEATIYVEWRQICVALSSDISTCESITDHSSGSLRVGIQSTGDTKLDGTNDDYAELKFTLQTSMGADSTTGLSLTNSCDTSPDTGICYFEISSGDKKAVARKVIGHSGFPSLSNNSAKYVRFYYLGTNSSTYDSSLYDQINPTTTHQDIAINTTEDGNVSLDNRWIDNEIQNGNTYYFKVALIDYAGNIGYYTAKAADEYCANITPTTSACHTARPGEVAGLLPENTNCFIATASYGSVMAPEVQTFREFRNRYLLTSEWGKKFVRFYYKHSPYFADIIRNSKILRSISRMALWPILGFAKLTLALNDAEDDFFSETPPESSAPTKSLDSEPPPRPEPPYPGSSDQDIDKQTKQQEANQARPLQHEKPIAIDEDGTYHYDTKTNSVPASKTNRRIEQPTDTNDQGEFFYDTKKESTSNSPPPKKPLAKEKPIEVRRDGFYQYKVDSSEQTGAASLRIAQFTTFHITNSKDSSVQFKNVYSSSNLYGVLGDYAWTLTDRLGRIDLKLTSGIVAAQGKGQFIDGASRRADDLPEEKLTFLLLPNQLTLAYRFQYAGGQWIVPYIEGGGGYFTFAEFRDDNTGPKFGAAFVGVGAAGVQFLMDWLEPRAIRELDNEYGINHIWLSGEFRKFVGSGNLDFSSDVISAGVSLDF